MQQPFDPADLGEHMEVPFAVRALPAARVLWLNERWLIEAGIDPLDSLSRASFAASLCKRFAVMADNDAPDSDPALDVLFADRYGGTDGSVHGGSGRCGSRDGFIAKGIGRTPLANPMADIYHRNGMLWLAEALKEALWAEIAERELPWGAIPVVAIIDAGFSHPDPEGRTERRAAIVVRPKFIRPAHFERSIYFGSAGDADSDQFKDALRVRDAIVKVSSCPEVYPSLREMFRRFAAQIGVARALRLWQGRFLTSNIAIDGKLVDFGAFRSVPDWRKAIGLAGECFGAEMRHMKFAFLSVASYFAKYAPESPEFGNVRSILAEMMEVEQKSFGETCLRALGVASDGSAQTHAIEQALQRLYQQQQSTKVDVLRPGGVPEQQMASDFLAILGTIMESAPATLDALRMQQFFQTRPTLNYEYIEHATCVVERSLAEPGSQPSDEVGTFIEDKLARSILWSALLPSELSALAVAANLYSAVLHCRRRNGFGNVFWIIAARLGDELLLLGNKVMLGPEIPELVTLPGGAVCFELPAGEVCGSEICLAGRTLPVVFHCLQTEVEGL